MGFEWYRWLWEFDLFWHKTSKKIKRNNFCTGSLHISLYFKTTILSRNTYGFYQKVVLISLSTVSSPLYLRGFFNLFHFIISFLSFSILRPIPPTPTMTSANALPTPQSIPLLIVFKIISIYIFSYFVLFCLLLIRFNFQCRWTGDPHRESPSSSLSLFLVLFKCLLVYHNSFRIVHFLLLLLLTILTVRLPTHAPSFWSVFPFYLFN